MVRYPKWRGICVTPGRALRSTPHQGFNPVTDINWASLFKADGPKMQLQQYADADPVVSWPDEMDFPAAFPVTSATPTFTASLSTLNNRAAVENNNAIESAFGTTLSVGTSFILVLNILEGATPASGKVLGSAGLGDSSPSARLAFGTLDDVWRIRQGTNISGTTSYVGGGSTCLLAVGNVTSDDQLYVNGTQEVSANSGTWQSNEPDGVVLFDQPGGGNGIGDFHIAFAGVYEGDITLDAKYADLKVWIENYYGIPQA